jgi:hypothetical protein
MRGTAQWKRDSLVNDYVKVVNGTKTSWRDTFTFAPTSLWTESQRLESRAVNRDLLWPWFSRRGIFLDPNRVAGRSLRASTRAFEIEEFDRAGLDGHLASRKQGKRSPCVLARAQELWRWSGRHRFRLLPRADWEENVTHLGPD